MNHHKIGALVVMNDGHMVGIFTERDAVFRVLADGRNPETTPLSVVMTEKPRTIGADKAVGHALMMMYDGGFRHVPVVENGKPLGMISARDALGPELRRFESDLVQREHIGEVL
jgi:CBS domain-containing protein